MSIFLRLYYNSVNDLTEKINTYNRCIGQAFGRRLKAQSRERPAEGGCEVDKLATETFLNVTCCQGNRITSAYKLDKLEKQRKILLKKDLLSTNYVQIRC